jgi:uncharacterized protein (TIGR03118 family)
VEPLEERALLAVGFLQTNMISDIAGLANVTDPNLQNPWGLTPTGEFWVSDNNSGVSTLYDGIGTPAGLVVTIPPIAGSAAGTVGQPSGIVSNPFTGQNNTPAAFDVVGTGGDGTPAAFIFDSQDGVISAWNFGLADNTKAIAEVNNAGADYTGLAIGQDGQGNPRLYAANFTGGTIDVFDSNFASIALGATAFKDTQVPAGYGPFNIQSLGGKLYVEYAKIDPATGEGKLGPGNGGFVDIYNGDGVLQKRIIAGGALDSPWGVTIAPTGFGGFGKDLLVGNFGNGWINVFDPTKNYKFVATISNPSGKPIVNDHLWAINAGTGTNGQLANAIYFTAGIQNEQHGLFGSIQAIPSLSFEAPLLPNLTAGAKQTFNTVPANGDQNPYGLAFVTGDYRGGGLLHPGDLLVANFNNASTQANPTGIQGTGSTIVRITPSGGTSVFFQGAPGLGLTTALRVLKNGFVLVGSVPTPDGTAANIQPGTLFVLNSSGNIKLKLTGNLLDSPWDLTVNDQGNTAQVFVSNVVGGTVTRVNLVLPAPGTSGKVKVQSETVIGADYTSQPNTAAVILGPTGLAYDPATDTLYVASTADNAVYAIADAAERTSDAGRGTKIFANPHLRGPLGLVLAPNGNLIVANGDAVNPDPNNKQNSELLEFTPGGSFVGQFQVDAALGSAFGIAVTRTNGLRFAAVDDNTNTVTIWTF